MTSDNKFQRILGYAKYVFYLAFVATVIFIFVNSAIPPEKSEEQSDRVSEIISTVIPPETDLGQFILTYIRKIAHFTEYGLLGIEISVYVFIYMKRRAAWGAASLAVPLAVGFTDESIQIISGRGPSISDVWIDIGGFATFSLITYASLTALYFLVKLIVFTVKRAKEKRNTSD